MRYERAFGRFSKWYKTMGKKIMEGKGMVDADEELWLLWLAHEDVVSTFDGMRSRLFGIKFYYKMIYGFDPFKMDRYGRVRRYERFEMVYRQMKRNQHKRPKKKFSLTKLVLLKCKDVIDEELFDDVLCWAIVVVGVHCLLRWSEITDSGRGLDSENKLLKRENLGLSDTSLWLDLNDTKTKLFGDPMTVECNADGTSLCPIAAMKKWLKIRPKKSKWIFCHKDGKVVKTRWVQNRLRNILKKCGYESRDLNGGMSMRKGGALSMALCGVPDRVIRAYGRWKSFAYRTYIDITKDEKNKWERVMADKTREMSRGGYEWGNVTDVRDEVKIYERLRG